MGWDSPDVVNAILFFATVAALFATVTFSAWCCILIMAAYDLIKEKLRGQ